MRLCQNAAAWCILLLVLLAGWSAYRPGLAGAFVFDDFANLPALGDTGPIVDGPALARYLTSGRADPIGRPLAMASFLVDAHDWPADPLPLKRTNVLLHLFNVLLLFVVLQALGKALHWTARRSAVAALAGAALWGLHPFLVSTVLYVVQREAILPTTFALLAFLFYMAARRRSIECLSAGATAFMMSGIGICTLLATLSKANGLLVPLLVWIVHSVLPAVPDERRFNRWCFFLLGPLAIAVPAWLCWEAFAAWGHDVIPLRGWSIRQRLLTEPSILWDYMAQLALIKPSSSSLLHDDITVATGWTTPWYTIPAILAWLGAIGCAFFWRRRAPALALGVLIFAAGHLIESTSLPLELYFDHRNYLPSIFLFWWAGAALGRASSRTLIVVPLTAACALFAALTYANARTWGDTVAQAAEWARTHPRSARAQAYAAQVYAAAGRLDRARSTIDAAASMFTDEPQIALNLIDIHCKAGALSRDDIRYAKGAFQQAQREPGALLLNWMTGAAIRARQGGCTGFTRDALEGILDSAMTNTRIASVPGRRQDIFHLRGVLALTWQQPAEATTWFDIALAVLPTPSAALGQAAELGKAGYPAYGLRHLDYFVALRPAPAHSWRAGMPWVHDQVLALQDYWPKEISHLRAQLSAAAARDASKAVEQLRGSAPHLK